jgi:Skp family chaperone for outer membrane proteins
LALFLLVGTAGAILFRVTEGLPWWYSAWIAITGGTATGTIAWLTAVTYTTYEEFEIMVLSNIVRQRDRKAAEEVQQKLQDQKKILDEREQELAEKGQELAEKGQELAEKGQELAEKGQELAEKGQELAEKGQELAEKEQALEKLAERLPPEHRAEFERLRRNGEAIEREG